MGKASRRKRSSPPPVRPDAATVAARLEDLVESMEAKYPDAWGFFEENRLQAGRREGLPRWPDWCWCPMTAAVQLVEAYEQPIPEEDVIDVFKVSAAAAWREGKGIYRIDADLEKALLATPVGEEVPTDVIFRLPEWAVYLALPGS